MRVLTIIASDHGSGGERLLPPGDRAAVHWGVTLAGAGCRVQTPQDDQTAILYATAMGATCERWRDGLESSVDLILIGPGAISRFGDHVAGQLAEQFSAELLFDGLKVDYVGNGWKVRCDAGHGAQDILHVQGPLVLVVSEQATRPPYVSQHRLAQAARLAPAQFPSSEPIPLWQPVLPRVPRSAGNSLATAESRADTAFGIAVGSCGSQEAQIVAEAPAVCAQVLLRYLVHHGFVSRSLAEIIPAAAVRTVQKPVAATTAVQDREVTEAILRGPRRPTDSATRLARQPRRASANYPAPAQITWSPLQRGPRRPNSTALPGQRGPFPFDAKRQSNPSYSQSQSAAIDFAPAGITGPTHA